MYQFDGNRPASKPKGFQSVLKQGGRKGLPNGDKNPNIPHNFSPSLQPLDDHVQLRTLVLDENLPGQKTSVTKQVNEQACSQGEVTVGEDLLQPSVKCRDAAVNAGRFLLDCS